MLLKMQSVWIFGMMRAKNVVISPCTTTQATYVAYTTGRDAVHSPSRAMEMSESNMVANPSTSCVSAYVSDTTRPGRLYAQSIEQTPPTRPMVLLYPTTKLSGFFHFSSLK
jgi:hypothetical protein